MARPAWQARSYLRNLSISVCRGNQSNSDGLSRGDRRGPHLAPPEPSTHSADDSALRCGLLACWSAWKIWCVPSPTTSTELEGSALIQGDQSRPGLADQRCLAHRHVVSPRRSFRVVLFESTARPFGSWTPASPQYCQCDR